jgi:hypothetical protein
MYNIGRNEFINVQVVQLYMNVEAKQAPVIHWRLIDSIVCNPVILVRMSIFF